jgi:hypothetical protein
MITLYAVKNSFSLSFSQARPLHHRGLLCNMHKNRPIMVPIAGFLIKSTLFIIYLQFIHISNFFQIFPKTCVADRVNGAAPYAHISLASAGRPADDRERPCFRPVPAYANFLLLLAAFYMRLIFPETRTADRETGKPQAYKFATIFHMLNLSWKIVQKRDIINFVVSPSLAISICFQERDKNRDQCIFWMGTDRRKKHFFLL